MIFHMNTATANTHPAGTDMEALTLVVGRPFPARRVVGADGRLIRHGHAAAVALIQSRRSWWLDAADAFIRQAEAGCIDALHDAREAFAAAEALRP